MGGWRGCFRVIRVTGAWFILLGWATVVTTVHAQPYQEAPFLATRVAAGDLPPVEQRLPDQPVVVQPIKEIGRYGGTWRGLARRVGDMGLNSRLGYEALLRWDPTGSRIIPGVAENWEVNTDATEFTFHLRKGMKWSDGHPFTSEDFAFTHEHLERNTTLTVTPTRWKVSGGRLMELDAPDPHTVVMRFAKPYGSFPRMLAFRGSQLTLFSPKHYLKQFHPAFTDPREVDRQARGLGFVSWAALLTDMRNLDKNPELPSINPFVCAIPFPAPRCLAVRNPYYWKVDPKGNQLPYIDQIAYASVFDNNVLNLKAMNGEADFQTLYIDAGNYVLFMTARDQAPDPLHRYRVHVENSTNIIAIYLNQHSRNEVMRPILQDRRFRIALSVAINRAELNELCFFGLAQPSNGVTTPYDRYYTDGIDQLHTQYDPALANRLLDEAGFQRGRDGMRRLPNGEPFRQVLHVFPSETGDSMDIWMLVAEYWREVGLHFIVKFEDGTLSALQARSGNSDFWAYASGGINWDLDGLWYAPLAQNSYYAPLYGRYFESGGKAGVKPPPEHQRLVEWYHQMRSTLDDQVRIEIGRQVMRQWAEQCYVIGIGRKPELFIISNRFRNVPDQIILDYTLMTPGYLGIEQFWLDEVER